MEKHFAQTPHLHLFPSVIGRAHQRRALRSAWRLPPRADAFQQDGISSCTACLSLSVLVFRLYVHLHWRLENSLSIMPFLSRILGRHSRRSDASHRETRCARRRTDMSPSQARIKGALPPVRSGLAARYGSRNCRAHCYLDLSVLLLISGRHTAGSPSNVPCLMSLITPPAGTS